MSHYVSPWSKHPLKEKSQDNFRTRFELSDPGTFSDFKTFANSSDILKQKDDEQVCFLNAEK